MQKIFWSWAHRDVGWMQYNLIEGGAGGSNALWGGDKKDWGLLEESLFAPRFLYGAVTAFTGNFAGYRSTGFISGDSEETPNTYFCTFTNAEKLMLVYWSVSETTNRLLIEHLGSGATSFDEMGNPLSVMPKGSFEIECRAYPRWLRFEKWANPKVTRLFSGERSK
jgi:hypothetical protein